MRYGDTGTHFKLDEKDQQILSSLLEAEYSSRRDLAELLGLPIATLEHRVKRLMKAGIIVRFIYLVNPNCFHAHSSKLLVFARGLSSKGQHAFSKFCASHPKITSYARTLGSWDFEINVELTSPEELIAVTQDITDTFGPGLNRIETLNQFRELKISSFPFFKATTENLKLAQ